MARQHANAHTSAAPTKAMETSPISDSNSAAPVAPSVNSVDREQAIREAAYACFEARGCEPGHELDDWLRAEALVQQANGGADPLTH
jgi:hypothetical protein